MIAASTDMDVEQSHSKSDSPSPRRQGGSENAEVQTSIGQLRFAAMALLAQREHSRYELQQKLLQRYCESVLIDQVLQQLADEDLQSDRRFAEAFVAMRVRKGQGPIRIRAELAQRCVDKKILTQVLLPYKDQWPEHAYTVWKKKYGISARQSAQERAKQQRFLLYRGFSQDHIKSLWRDYP